MPATSILGSFVDVAGTSATAAAPAADQAKVLTFQMQTQDQSEWCWAAVGASVCSYYAARGNGGNERQCDIATRFLGMNCCVTPWPPGSNQTFTLQTPLQVLGHLSSTIEGPLDMDAIVREIDGGRPICCHIDWGDGEGHFVAIVGYDAVHNDVIARDPLGTSVNGVLPFKNGSTFHGGSWTETYLTQ